jgi:hypothetical protein
VERDKPGAKERQGKELAVETGREDVPAKHLWVRIYTT